MAAARNMAKKATPRKSPGRRETKAAAPAPGATTTVKPATPAAPSKASAEPSGGFGQRKDEFMRYLQAVRGEFNRVTWPGNTNSFSKSLTSPEMKGATAVVLTTLLFFSMYLGFLDFLLIRIFGWIHK